jgi:RNA polymerase sigma-54 factor
MAINQRLDLRQAQSLVMTPQLQQAIKLLQLSNLELSAYIQQELEQNPLLQRVEGDDETGGGDRAEERDDAPSADTGETAGDDTLNLAADDGIAQAGEAPLDTDYDNMWNGEAGGDGPTLGLGASGGSRNFDDDGVALDQLIADEISLADHLYAQINADFEDPHERLIAVHLAGVIDDAGYLPAELEPVAGTLGCSVAELERVIAKLQNLDPPGIFARSLAECLALQLADRNRLDPAMQALLDHLDLVARGDLAGLRRLCGVDQEDMTEMLAELRRLNPKPALAFGAPEVRPVTPDVLVRPDRQGGWIVELNNDTLPRVLVDRSYYTRVGKQVRNGKERAYLADRLQSANWLVKALHQRATTILKVAQEIVRQQDGFLRQGIQHLKPLVLRDIAEAIEMHESTVSRVTANKYMATPRGIYELKYFFTAAIAGTNGSASLSAESVRHRIRAMIDAENPAQVLSDDTIVEGLRAEGIDIARRTVAKYREAMRIPSSVERRRLKAALT